MKLVCTILILLWGNTLLADNLDSTNEELGTTRFSNIDTADSLQIAIPPKKLIVDSVLTLPKKYNPLISMGLSAILPGAGQIYCRRRARGTLFLATEFIWALVAKNRYDHYKYAMKYDLDYFNNQISQNLENMLLSINDVTAYNTHYEKYIDAYMGYDLARYKRRSSRYISYHCIGWTSGIYLWNILDALQSSKYFFNVKPRKPAAAAWLSAIPFLGLGQIYNGSYAKAGLIWTIHTMLAYMAYNYNLLMNDCINKRNQVNSSISAPGHIKADYIDKWDDEYNFAFKNRNTYLWYLVLFYFYGIFDAAVDAHLHDYKIKIRLEPKTEENTKSVTLNMCVEF